MNLSNGRVWPYAIGISITMVFGFCVATIMVTQSANIQESDSFMTFYQDADAKANELIRARISFDRVYTIEYISDGIAKENGLIQYRVMDKEKNPINNAKITIATSRPETAALNQKLENPTIEDGVYSFSGGVFPKEGVWNIIAKVEIADESRFYNIKADTRTKDAFEF